MSKIDFQNLIIALIPGFFGWALSGGSVGIGFFVFLIIFLALEVEKLLKEKNNS